MKLLFLYIFFFTNLSLGQTPKTFDNLKSVLQNDRLEQKQQEKKEENKKIEKKIQQSLVNKYNYPTMQDLQNFLVEMWLVKNATMLKWDFKKPDYGVMSAFLNLLESLGYYKKNIKILYINSTEISHFAFPLDKNSYIFLISVPFIRTLDLSKLEISLLLLENMLRIELGQFGENINYSKLQAVAGKNFYKNQKPNLEPINDILKQFNSLVYNSGYNFQQQFSITKKMDSILKPVPTLWNSYLKMLGKIDRLIKTNLLFEKYNKIYPSPEMQIKWLTPKKKVL